MNIILLDQGVRESIGDDCGGILRNIVCWYEFPACVDNGNKTWVYY